MSNTERQESMRIVAIAQICHEANRAYCKTLGDNSQLAWDDAPGWQKDSAIDGVLHALKEPNITVREMHENWLKTKLADGWKHGAVKDAEKKEHPCCVPFDQLPVAQKKKDDLFLAIVRALQ